MSSTVTSGATPGEVREFGPFRALAFQILPGLASLPLYAAFAWWFDSHGLPNIAALILAVVLAEVPASWAIMVWQVRRETGRFRLRSAFPWLAPLRLRQYLLLGVPIVLLSVAINAGVGGVGGQLLREALFPAVPEWFAMQPDPADFAQMSDALLLLLWLSMFAGLVFLGGVTQELYSRGFLLPRTARLGRYAPILNAAGFAMLHTAAPWSWPAFFMLSLPWAFLVWHFRSVKIGLFTHVGMLTVQWLAMSIFLFGAAPSG